MRNTTLTMGLLLLLLACLDERRLYSVTIVNAAQRDLKEVSVGFPGYSVRLPLAAGGRAGELQVPFALPRTANVAWTNMDGTVHRQLVRFPEKWPATPKSGDGLLFTITEDSLVVSLQIRTPDSYYPQEIQLYRATT